MSNQKQHEVAKQSDAIGGEPRDNLSAKARANDALDKIEALKKTAEEEAKAKARAAEQAKREAEAVHKAARQRAEAEARKKRERSYCCGCC